MSEAAYDIQVQLERWRDEAQAAVDSFVSLRQRTEESSRHLESPPGVLQFIDFFAMFFADAVAVFERVRAELDQPPQKVHAEALQQVASNAALEQRRCLQFRDKWINRPLPYEDVRPLLTEIVNVAPRLAPCTDDLREEHLALLEAWLRAEAAVRGARQGWATISSVRRQVTTLLGRLTLHRQAGADLVFEAYNVDIGALD